MKKKLFLSILALFMFSVCLIRVNAAEPLFSVGWELEPATPKMGSNGNIILPDADKTYGTVTDYFNFSPVKFLDTSGNEVSGDAYLNKIIVGELGTITGNNSAKKQSGESNEQYVNRLLTNYFTGYCLDKNLKYPEYGLFNSHAYADGVEADGSYNALVADVANFRGEIVKAAVINDPTFTNIANKLLDEFNGDLTGLQMIHSDQQIAGYIADSIPTGHIDEFGPYFMGDTQSPDIKIGISYIGFNIGEKKVFFASNEETHDDLENSYPDASVYYLTGSAYSEEFYPLKTNLPELAFQKYKKSDAGNKHNHALWIVENSFPTLDVDTTLSLAGVNKADFDAKIKSLYSEANDNNIAKYEKMIMFGIVQYAVWQVEGAKVDGHKLAPTMTSAATATDPFDILYRYLTQAEVPSNYDRPTAYSNKITVTKPDSKKALTNKVDPAGKYDFYGPYKATYSALVEDGTKISYTIKNNKNNDFKIVDSNFKDIKELGKDQQFYIAVNNKLTKGTVNIDLTVKNVTTFKPEGNRGKIFSPVLGMSQNVLVGGRVTQTDITGSFSQDIFKNVETGIQNIALLLMVTLVAFAVGYFVLSYKQKPVQLQK